MLLEPVLGSIDFPQENAWSFCGRTALSDCISALRKRWKPFSFSPSMASGACWLAFGAGRQWLIKTSLQASTPREVLMPSTSESQNMPPHISAYAKLQMASKKVAASYLLCPCLASTSGSLGSPSETCRKLQISDKASSKHPLPDHLEPAFLIQQCIEGLCCMLTTK